MSGKPTERECKTAVSTQGLLDERCAKFAAAWKTAPPPRIAVRCLLLAACRHGDPDRVFHYQELLRGRLLWELWQDRKGQVSQVWGMPCTDLDAVQERLRNVRSALSAGTNAPDAEKLRDEELQVLLLRDRMMENMLAKRERPPDKVIPPLPTTREVQKHLPRDTAYIALNTFRYEVAQACSTRS